MRDLFILFREEIGMPLFAKPSDWQMIGFTLDGDEQPDVVIRSYRRLGMQEWAKCVDGLENAQVASPQSLGDLKRRFFIRVA